MKDVYKGNTRLALKAATHGTGQFTRPCKLYAWKKQMPQAVDMLLFK